MAIGRVVSVHFYSYAPWRGVWIENTATIKGNENLVRYAPWRGVWIEIIIIVEISIQNKAASHGIRMD